MLVLKGELLICGYCVLEKSQKQLSSKALEYNIILLHPKYIILITEIS
jgi:hypothetical protein